MIAQLRRRLALGRRRPRGPFPAPPAGAGSALIVALWVVGLLSLFISSFAFDMKVEARITSMYRKRLKAEYLARAGIELATMTLIETTDPDIKITEDVSIYLDKGEDVEMRKSALALTRGKRATITRALGGGEFVLDIVPDNARYDVNSLIYWAPKQSGKAAFPDETMEMWEPLLEHAGIPRDLWETLVESYIDWRDIDELEQLNGEEDYRDKGYDVKNGPLDTVEELRLIQGFGEPLDDSDETPYDRLKPFLTVAAKANGKLNVNAADFDTLVAILDVDEEIAEWIIGERANPEVDGGSLEDNSFKNWADLSSRVPGLDDHVQKLVSFAADARYRVTCRGRYATVEKFVDAVLRLSGNEVFIERWRE